MIQGNQVNYNGYVSTREFVPPSFAFTPKERVSSSEVINIPYAQQYGVFYFEMVEEVQADGNSFTWCAAIEGTGFYSHNSAYRATFNTFQYMVAVNGGAVMRQVGVGVRSAITDETVDHTLGVAYDLEGGDEADIQASMYYFKKLVMQNCAGEEAGFFRFVRSGGVQCNQCELSMRDIEDREDALIVFRDAPAARSTIFEDEYLYTRLLDGLNTLGPVQVLDSNTRVAISTSP